MKSPDDICIKQVHEDSSGHLYVRMKNLKVQDKKRMAELMVGMQCPKDFKCIDLGSEDLCKARDSGLENYLECIDHNRYTCKFIVRFGDGYFCYCPLRVYLKKKLKK